MIDAKLVLAAANRALAELSPHGVLDALDSQVKGNADWSCNNFGPGMLGYVIEASEGEANTSTYKGISSDWPASFPLNCLVNFMILFKESSENHNFNVYFDGVNSAFLIQVYVDHTIRISTPHDAKDFISTWRLLGTKDWAGAYEKLFYVQPKNMSNVCTEQHVTVVTAS